jgi:DNA repair ATPase RecN
MDSESLNQIRKEAKEAVEELIDHKLNDKIETKISALLDKIEYKISPLIQKLNSIYDLCTALSSNLSELRHADIPRINAELEKIKKLAGQSGAEKPKTAKPPLDRNDPKRPPNF